MAKELFHFVFIYRQISAAHAPSRINKNAKLNAEKSKIYFFAPPWSCFVYSRKVIRLAREEINVPTPPMLTPYKRA